MIECTNPVGELGGEPEKVTKVHPDRLLVVDAYSVYAAPPAERKLHPNLVVRFAPLAYGDEDYRQESVRAQDGQARDEINVLFIGNSLTYYNDLPKMVAALAKADKQRPPRADE